MPIVFNMKMFDSESRIVVERGNGYESIMKHSHDFIEIVYVESGYGLQIVDGSRIKINKGDIFLMTGKECHSIRPLCDEKDFKLVNVIFEQNVVDADLSVFKCDKTVNILSDDEIVDLIYRMEKEYIGRKKHFEIINKGYLYQLLGFLARKFEKKDISSKNVTVSVNKEYVRRAVAYIKDNYAEKITLNDIAKHIGLSKGYLQKVFNRESETSIIEYLLHYRIEQACKLLLENDYSIAQISNMVGFSDVKNFYVIFKRNINETPGEYRESHRKKETEVKDDKEQ